METILQQSHVNQTHGHVVHHHVDQMLNVVNVTALVHASVMPAMKAIHTISIVDVVVNVKRMSTVTIAWPVFDLSVLIHATVSAEF